MSLSVARPDVANLVLRAYGRALHPDLLDHHMSSRITLPGVTVDLRLTSSGHAFVVHHNSRVLTELISERGEAAPVRGQLLETRIAGCRTETIEFENGLRYDTSCTLERLGLAVYLRAHEELVADGSRASLFVEFPGKNRFSPGPLSILQAEVSRETVSIHAFHTFPEQLAVVKTQALLQL